MWTAHLFQTISGTIGPRIDFEKASWSVSLNETESLSVDLRKSDLPKVDLNYWLAPWWAGVVYMWDGKPIVAGPIISRRSESYEYIYIDCVGIRGLLARRFTALEQSNWANLAKSVISYTGLSLGTIAQRVVKVAMSKQGGMLPITFPIVEETAANDADHQRTYRGFNLQNINCDDVLTKLSNVVNGPDIMFKPRLIDDNTLTFDMWHGTELNPRIMQFNTPTWDIGADQSSVSDIDITMTGAYQTSRVYAIGAGQDQGKLIKVNSNLSSIQQGFPLLETTRSSGNSENPAVVNAHSLAELRNNANMLQEIQMSVAARGLNGVGTFWPGDSAKLSMKGFLALDDGMHDVRILNMNGSHKEQVKLSVQAEDQYLIADNTEDDYAV